MGRSDFRSSSRFTLTYKSSKKNLFRKYKWWKQKRAEEEKGGVKSGKRILVEQDATLCDFVGSAVGRIAKQGMR